MATPPSAALHCALDPFFFFLFWLDKHILIHRLRRPPSFFFFFSCSALWKTAEWEAVFFLFVCPVFGGRLEEEGVGVGVGYLAENWLLTCSGKASVSNELGLLTCSKVYRSKSTLKFGIQLKLLFFDLFKALKKLILDSHPNFTGGVFTFLLLSNQQSKTPKTPQELLK